MAYRIWTSCPPMNVRVNLAHPLARDLAWFAYRPFGFAVSGTGTRTKFNNGVLNGMQDGYANQITEGCTGGYNGTLPGTISNSILPADSGPTFGASLNDGGSVNFTFSNPYARNLSSCCVIAKIRARSANSTNDTPVVSIWDATDQAGPVVGFDHTGAAMGGYWSDTGYGTLMATDGVNHFSSTGIGDWVVVGGSCGNATIGNTGKNLVWVNGRRTVGPTGNTNRDGATHGIYMTFGGRTANADIAWAMVFTRTLNDPEHLFIARNPWQILMPQPNISLTAFTAPAGSLPPGGGLLPYVSRY